MAKFVVFGKRVSQYEARIRVFCMTDDKEDKTLEHQEHFVEIAKSRDIEILENKDVFMEFAGNLVPVLQSGEQPKLGFRAFRENRCAFTVRLRDSVSWIEENLQQVSSCNYTLFRMKNQQAGLFLWQIRKRPEVNQRRSLCAL